MHRPPEIQYLEFLAFQLCLLEYEHALRQTPSGAWHPIPPTAPKGRRASLREIERVRDYLGHAWRGSDLSIRTEHPVPQVEADEYKRTHRADLWDECLKMTKLESSVAAIEWGERVRCDGDMIWVHMPNSKFWELVYIEGYPGTNRHCARSIVTEEVLYELQEDGNSLHGNIPKMADCSFIWDDFKQDRKTNWDRAAKEVVDKWAEREGFAINKDGVI